MSGSYVVAALRTPIGNFGKGLAGVAAPDLGAVLIREFLSREVCCPEEVDEVIFGNVLQAGLGMNPARQAAVRGGLPYAAPAYTVNMVCASGLQAILLADRAIRGEHAATIIAGGFENMSRAPFLLPTQRWGTPLGNGRVADELLLDGLWDCFYDCHMATTVESLAATRGISRRAQDEFAAESHRRAIAAFQGGRFSDEIVAVDTPSGRLESDEHPRADSSLERLSALKPSFAKDGTITAGNSSGLNDGAAAVVLSSRQLRAGGSPMAELLDFTVVGVDPMEMGLGPVKAIRELLARNSLATTNIDLWEINEAFSAQALAVVSELRLPVDRVNVNGGAVALGHPIGASGARILVTLIHEMRRRNAELGVASLCVGGGLGIAALIRLGA
jgi:acetyl-CoA C-acetyltransferase